jgi:broad specificity phosphatase PhoE
MSTHDLARLVLIRHALSAQNDTKNGSVFHTEESRKKVEGIPDHDIALQPEGHRQALVTGERVRERFGVPDLIVHSGYLRTIETMNGILHAYSPAERACITIEEDLLIRERHAGYTYHMTSEEAERHFPYLQPYWDLKGGFVATPPGGESLEDAVTRIAFFLEILRREHRGKKVFVITHGGMMRCFRHRLEKWTYARARAWKPGEEPKNCGVTWYEYDAHERRLVLREYNTVYWE